VLEMEWSRVRRDFCLGSLECATWKKKVVNEELSVFHTQSFELRFRLLVDAGKVNVSTCNHLIVDVYFPSCSKFVVRL
jgi:hypothetical protein